MKEELGDAEGVLHTDPFGAGNRNQIFNFKAEVEVTISKEAEWKEIICDLPKGPVSAAPDASDSCAEHKLVSLLLSRTYINVWGTNKGRGAPCWTPVFRSPW